MDALPFSNADNDEILAALTAAGLLGAGIPAPARLPPGEARPGELVRRRQGRRLS
ncbi:MAG: hypothetical protein R2719_01225 [Micropruina sp.]